jgi:hypothetical protein
MSRTTAQLKEEIHKSLGLVRTLRDEIRVQLHLGSLDAREEWRKLEPELDRVERAASEFTEATCTAVSELMKRMAKLRSRLGRGS